MLPVFLLTAKVAILDRNLKCIKLEGEVFNSKRVKRAAKVVPALPCMRITAPLPFGTYSTPARHADTFLLLSFFPFFLLKNLRFGAWEKKLEQVFI